MRDDEDAQAGGAAGDEDEPERPAGGKAVRDEAADEVSERHSSKDDSDDARPRVQRDADVGRHDAPGDQLDDERAGAADEREKTGEPHRPGTAREAYEPRRSRTS